MWVIVPIMSKCCATAVKCCNARPCDRCICHVLLGLLIIGLAVHKHANSDESESYYKDCSPYMYLSKLFIPNCWYLKNIWAEKKQRISLPKCTSSHYYQGQIQDFSWGWPNFALVTLFPRFHDQDEEFLHKLTNYWQVGPSPAPMPLDYYICHKDFSMPFSLQLFWLWRLLYIQV